MSKLFASLLAVPVIAAFSTVRAFSDDANALSGRWSLTGADDQGQMLSRLLDIKTNKFTFSIVGDDGKVAFYEEGDIKLEKLGPFDTILFYNRKVGRSSLDTQPVAKERVSIYQLEAGTLTLASNFDARRNQKASLDTYTKVVAADNERMTLNIEKIVMHQTPQAGTWFVCFEAKSDGPMQRFHVPKQRVAKDGVAIQMDLKVPNVRRGQTCEFKCQLDDVEENVCKEVTDHTSSGQFTILESGSQEIRPKEHWRYTIYWHLK